ncbi:MAG: GMC family oxidoreductase N-terminal domain-containing protein [Parvularculaceae bacterium]
MIYIRGSRADYDNWAAHGATGWSWDDVFPYFLKAEDNERGSDGHHSIGGPLGVADLRYKNPLSDLFLEAAGELQLPANSDFNGERQLGVGYYQVTQRDGQRCSAARAYLHPAMSRQNLTVLTDAHSERVTFEGKRATGVHFTQNGVKKSVTAKREVILSAGAFQSPQLLQLSGVGPATHLKQHGIDVVADRAGVGENLQDHLDWTALYTSPSPDAVGMSPKLRARALPSFLAYKNRREGPNYVRTLAECGGF